MSLEGERIIFSVVFKIQLGDFKIRNRETAFYNEILLFRQYWFKTNHLKLTLIKVIQIFSFI